MSAFNCWRCDVPNSGVWLLLVEPERACLALYSARAWIAVHNVRGRFPDVNAWTVLLDRERWQVELERVPDTVLVHAPGLSASIRSQQNGWNWNPLRIAGPMGLSPLEESPYTNALTAA
jgi:hypothetical protein